MQIARKCRSPKSHPASPAGQRRVPTPSVSVAARICALTNLLWAHVGALRHAPRAVLASSGQAVISGGGRGVPSRDTASSVVLAAWSTGGRPGVDSPEQSWGGYRWVGRCGRRVPVCWRPHSCRGRPFSWLHHVLPPHCPVCQIRSATHRTVGSQEPAPMSPSQAKPSRGRAWGSASIPLVGCSTGTPVLVSVTRCFQCYDHGIRMAPRFRGLRAVWEPHIWGRPAGSPPPLPSLQHVTHGASYCLTNACDERGASRPHPVPANLIRSSGCFAIGLCILLVPELGRGFPGKGLWKLQHCHLTHKVSQTLCEVPKTALDGDPPEVGVCTGVVGALQIGGMPGTWARLSETLGCMTHTCHHFWGNKFHLEAGSLAHLSTAPNRLRSTWGRRGRELTFIRVLLGARLCAGNSAWARCWRHLI